MNILQVIPWFPPSWAWGGPVRVAYDISREMVRRGHRVTVYATDSLNPEERVPVAHAIPVDNNGISVYHFRNVSNWLAGKHHIQICPQLINLARKDLCQFDVIHLHCYRTFQNIVVSDYARRYDIPYFVQAHGSLSGENSKQGLKLLYDYYRGNSLLKTAAGVLALNSSEQELYREKGVAHEKITVLENAVDAAQFQKLPSRGSFRHRFDIPMSDKVVLYLGRIHQSKGIGLLARSVYKLMNDGVKVKLVIAGPDDGYAGRLKKEISKISPDSGWVVFTGPLYGQEKLSAYADADIFATPCYQGFPVTFLEAAACGLPLLTTTASDQLDWIDGYAGLVTGYNETEMANALAFLIANDAKRWVLGDQGATLVKHWYNWERIADRLEQIYINSRNTTSSI